MNKPARRVAAGTFTKPPLPSISYGRDENDPLWDWCNPNDNPSGLKPVGLFPHKYEGDYNPDNYPVFEEEYQRRLFEPEMVARLKDVYGDDYWDTMPELAQIEAHLDFVGDYRNPVFGGIDLFIEHIDARAKQLQALIKR